MGDFLMGEALVVVGGQPVVLRSGETFEIEPGLAAEPAEKLYVFAAQRLFFRYPRAADPESDLRRQYPWNEQQ